MRPVSVVYSYALNLEGELAIFTRQHSHYDTDH